MLLRGGRLDAELWVLEEGVDGEGVWFPVLLGAADFGVGRGALLGDGGDIAGGGGARASVLIASSVAISGPLLLSTRRAGDVCPNNQIFLNSHTSIHGR